MPDIRVTTWRSKQVGFTTADLADDTEGEVENYIICISPDSVWLLRSMLSFYGYFYNRFLDFDRETVDDLVARTERSLIMPLGCEGDLTRIADALEAMLALQIDQALFLTELEGINNNLANINGTITAIGESALSESVFDDIEETLDDIGTVLGIVGAIIA